MAITPDFDPAIFGPASDVGIFFSEVIRRDFSCFDGPLGRWRRRIDQMEAKGNGMFCKIRGPTWLDRCTRRSTPLTSTSIQHDRDVSPSPRQWLHHAYAHAPEHDRRRHISHRAHKLWGQPVHVGVVATGRPEVFPFLTYKIGPFQKDEVFLRSPELFDADLAPPGSSSCGSCWPGLCRQFGSPLSPVPRQQFVQA